MTPPTHQLAAIMFTDIQGYTALMQQDEAKALEFRNRHREIFNATTKKFKGKILQYFGDGTLSTFSSAIDSVHCGIELQLSFLQEPQIPVRIGIHTGDIIFSKDDIIGDGVNVASRIESLATAGSIFISEKVYDEVKNQSGIQTDSLGIFELKNVVKPVEVFAITNPGLVIPEKGEITGKIKSESLSEKGKDTSIKRGRVRWALIILGGILAGYLLYSTGTFDINKNQQTPTTYFATSEKSIAVLPFLNLSNDPEQEYFSDGLSEEILNSLTHVQELKVVGRTSSFSFKGKGEDLRTIGNKLNVNLVLEGSVRKAGNRVRITAQLINVEDGYHIWSEQYDRELKDIFEIQEEIAMKIVENLKLTVLKTSTTSRPTENMEAYDLFLKANYFLDQDYEGTEKALEYFQKAIVADPKFALAYAGKAEAYLNYVFYGKMAPQEAKELILEAVQKSFDMGLQDPIAHRTLAYVNLFLNWDWKAAKSEYETAIDLGLNDPDHFITFYYLFVDEDFEKSISVAQQLVQRDPLSIEAHWHVGFCYFYARQYDNAIKAFRATLELNSNYSEGHRWLGKAFTHTGHFEEALVSLNKALDITQGQGPAVGDLAELWGMMGKKEEIKTILESSLHQRTERYISANFIAGLYTASGDNDQAFIWMEKAFEEKNMEFVGIKVAPEWDKFRSDPRFDNLVQRMNFPD